MTEQKVSVWLTYNQFKRLGEKCIKCEKIAKWLPMDGSWDCYCDDHFPYHNTEEEDPWE